jgi:alpha-tubulin suppressor-like RCC1 family protein
LQPIDRLPASNRLHLAIGLPLRNPEVLAQLLQQLSDPAHPNYRHYLTSAEFAARFGPTEPYYQAVIAFAQAHGLTVSGTHPNRTLLDVEGSVGDIEKALHLTLRVYPHPAEARTFYAPDAAPVLDLTVPVLGISGLNNYSLPRPRLQATPLDSGAGKTPAPLPKAGSGPNGTYMGNDFRAAYVPGSPLTGTGQVVGLLQFDGYTASDITYYETKAGLPNVPLSNVLLDGFTGSPTGSGGEVEVSLDIEMAISMAPGLAEVIVYMAGPYGNWHDILNRMATDNLAKQLSCSWYIPGGGSDPVADQIWQQMAAQGQSFYSASGDADAFAGPVDFPGETPYIVQVGGTTLTTSGPGGAWVSETVWNWGGGTGSGGGISTRYAIPSYQANISMTLNQGSTTMRNIPDVALTADNVYVRADGVDYNVGGTSCAAPLWAGFTALVNQQAVASGRPLVGFINPAVDTIGTGSGYATCFHDITTGNNTSSSSPTKFYAVAGYDLCTGWGTPAGQNLINALATPDPLLISPSALAFGGLVGGPFSPNPGWLTLTNSGATALSWTLMNTCAWFNVSPTSGTLSPGGAAASVSVSVATSANTLAAGLYGGVLAVTNQSSGVAQTCPLALSVAGLGMSDDFDPGLDLTQWSSFGGVVGSTVLATNYGGSVSASNSLWFGANGSRFATTIPIQTSGGGQIGFCIRLANGAAWPWARVDNLPAEGVVLECSTNGGGSWTVIGNYDTPAYYNWTGVVLPIPAVAQAPAALFRWRQLSNSGANYNHWALDNVVVATGSMAPGIVMDPQSQTVVVGDPVSFSVAAVGTLPLSYQWLMNGTNISGATASSLVFPSVQFAQAGTYAVQVTNAYGSTNSASALLIVNSPPPCAAPPAGLISWWQAESNALDFTGLDNGTPVGGLGYAPGKVGQAFSFNGTDAEVDMGTNAGNFGANDFSIEFWIQTTSTRAESVLGKRPACDGDSTGFWDMRISNGKLGMELMAPGVTDYLQLNATRQVNDGVYHHIAFVRQGTNGTLYIDGTFEVSGSTPGVTYLNTSGDFVIGRSACVGVDGTQYLTGQMDEITVYELALSLPQIQSIYNAGRSGKCTTPSPPAILVQPANQIAVAGDNIAFSVLAAGTQPLSYQWQFNGANLAAATASSLALSNVQLSDAGSYSVLVSNSVGTLLSSNALLTVNPPPPCVAPPVGLVGWWRAESNALDQVGGDNGTLYNGATYAQGRVGEAFIFNGTNSYVEVPDSPVLRLTNELTIEFWVKRQTLNPPTAEYLVEKGGDWTGGVQNYAVAIHLPSYNNCLHFLCAESWWGAGSIGDLNWHYCAVVARNGQTEPEIYIDGVQQAINYGGGTGVINLYPSTRPLHIGAQVDPVSGWNYFSKCFVDEMSLYNRALTPAEIQSIYAAERSGKCSTPTAPVILTQPTNQVAEAGDNVSFGVLVAGTPPLAYQWLLNGANLATATASSLALNNVQLSDAGSYSVLVSNSVGTVLSSNALLTVNPPPPCAAEPGGLVDWWPAQGNALDFVGTNNGTLVGGVTYTQGEVGQTFVFDGNGSYIDFGTSVGNFGAGDFTVEFWLSTVSTRYEILLSKRNICNADNLFNILIQSGELLFEVDGGASSYGFFAFQDTRTVNDGTFHHAALVRQGPTLSIYVDGVLSSSGTQAQGQVADVSSGASFQAGMSPCVGVDGTASFTGALDEISLYSRALTAVEIQSLYAAGRSGKCTVPTGPVVLASPTNLTVIAQSNAVFGVVAEGSAPLAYQWRLNSAAVAGQTNPSLLLVAVNPNQAGSYDVVVTNAVGAVTSAVAVLTVYVPPPPGFTLQPQGQTVPAGTNVTLTAVATNAWPISYQWYFGGTPLGGATSSALNLTDVQATNEGDYAVVAANGWNAATSTVATLTVVPAAPLLTLQPQSAGVFPGFQAQLSVAAAGTEPLAYQWQWYGTNIPDATNESYAVSNMGPAEAGPYQVIVSNLVGSTLSAQALLVMVPVACWGSTPIGLMSLPLGVTNAVALSAGSLHNLALRRDGSVVAWGAADQISVPAGLANAVAVSAGGDHSLALKADGSVVAWGANNAGQTNVPANLSNVVAVAAGASHSLALRASGTVVGWGLNTSGQINVPATLTNVVAISAGSNHSIALRADGKVFAWGNNASGQTNVPATLADVVAIAAGAMHNLALRSDGTVAAWGSSTYGQTNVPSGLSGVIAIGAGAFHSLAVKSDGTLVAWGAGMSSVPTTFPNLGQSYIPPTVTNVVAALGGQAHTLALAGDGPPFITAPPVSRVSYSGRRVVFGAAASGALPLSFQWQLNGSDLPGATSQLLVLNSATSAGSYSVVVTNALGSATSSSAVLTLVDSAPFITAQPVTQPAYLGVQELLQVSADGSGPLFYQWRLNGTNIAGATGSAFLLNHLQLSDAGSYSVVVSNTFGALSSMKVAIPVIQTVAWGAGTNYGSSPNSGQSIVPAGLNNAVAVAGGGYHSLALKADTKMLAWGAGATNTGILPNYGQSIVPAGLASVSGIAGGLYHSLAVRSDGSVAAWGAGTNYTGYQPQYGQCVVPVSASNVIAVAASDYDSFALRSDGKVVGWGYTLYSLTNVPTTATNVVAIGARASHALALRSDGSVVHWGSLTTLPPTPYNYVAIAVGVNQCLALRPDGTVVAWGGQYGVPIGLANVVDIATGYDHCVALRSDGTVVTWGATNTYNRNLIPPGLTNVVGIACGYYHSLAVLGDGSPFMKLQPASRAALVGTQTNLVAMAVGAQPLHFQWQFNGGNLAGATSSSLSFSFVQAPNAGSYRVVITNVFGSVTSSVATLTALVPLGQALNPSLPWSVSGNAAWFGETAVTHDGASAAQSGLITDSQSSTLQTTVVGAGTLSFWWKVSSEEFFDYLTFYIDGVPQAAISGEQPWQMQTYSIANGSHTLKWTYAKDPSVSDGSDAGWLDQVTFITSPPVITLQPLCQHGRMGNTITLCGAATGAPMLTYQWVKDGADLAGATSTAFYIASATRRDSGAYQLVATNPGGSTGSSNATLVVRSPQEMGPPVWLPGSGIAITAGDADGGPLLPGDLSNFQAQASTNLVDWTALLDSLSVTNGMLYFVDPDSTNAPYRFYRIIEFDPSGP